MCPPTILSLVPGSSTTLNISWSHPCGGPPTTHYFITTMFVSTAPGFSQRQESSATLPPSTTSSVLNNLELVSGNAYIFVVTAVSGPVSQSSAPMQFKIRTFKSHNLFSTFFKNKNNYYYDCIILWIIIMTVLYSGFCWQLIHLACLPLPTWLQISSLQPVPVSAGVLLYKCQASISFAIFQLSWEEVLSLALHSVRLTHTI